LQLASLRGLRPEAIQEFRAARVAWIATAPAAPRDDGNLLRADFCPLLVAKLARSKPRKGDAMIFEIAEIEVKAGEEAAFEAAVAKAVPIFQRSRGCLGMELQRSIETPSKYRLVVRWDTLEDHTVHFRGSEDFQEWRKLVGPHFASPPVVGHTSTVFAGF
jgi:heme-degrading monooxygenase HmoA